MDEVPRGISPRPSVIPHRNGDAVARINAINGPGSAPRSARVRCGGHLDTVASGGVKVENIAVRIRRPHHLGTAAMTGGIGGENRRVYGHFRGKNSLRKGAEEYRGDDRERECFCKSFHVS